MEHEKHPNHHAEDVIEENGEEAIPHEAFYSAVDPDYSASKQPFVPQSVQVAQKNTKYTTMGVTPGPIIRGCIDVFSFILALVLMAIQLGLIDYYYIANKGEAWYGWLAGDALVLIIFIWLVVVAVRKNQETMEETCSLDGKVRYAWIAWLFYSLLLVGKIATAFHLYYKDVAPTSKEDDKFFDDHLLKLTLCLSALIFIFLLEAHHYTPLSSPRQLYITYLMTAICLDLLDSVAFLDLLWENKIMTWATNLPFWTELAILCIGCANFVLPTFALLKLRFNRNQRVLFISDRVWSFLYVLLVNGPFLGIRIYLYVYLEWISKEKKNKYDASIFAIKNVAMIYIALRELWVRLHYWRQKRQALGSRGELTAQGANDHEDN